MSFLAGQEEIDLAVEIEWSKVRACIFPRHNSPNFRTLVGQNLI